MSREIGKILFFLPLLVYHEGREKRKGREGYEKSHSGFAGSALADGMWGVGGDGIHTCGNGYIHSGPGWGDGLANSRTNSHFLGGRPQWVYFEHLGAVLGRRSLDGSVLVDGEQRPNIIEDGRKGVCQDIRELFSFLDWEVDETYEYGPIGEPGTYQVSFGRDILCRSSDDMICIYLSGESRNDRLSFRADQAEFLCDEIADLWPGLEVNMGRVRVLPQKTKAETGELYVERLLEKLKADGHIADYELREVWVQAPEWLGSSDVFDPQLFVVHADFSLKPANLERSYWREESIWHDAPDAEGWVHYKDWQNMLCIDPRDGLFGMV